MRKCTVLNEKMYSIECELFYPGLTKANGKKTFPEACREKILRCLMQYYIHCYMLTVLAEVWDTQRTNLTSYFTQLTNAKADKLNKDFTTNIVDEK